MGKRYCLLFRDDDRIFDSDSGEPAHKKGS